MAISGMAKSTPAKGSLLRPFLVPAVRPSDLARKAGVSRQYVSAVLLGQRPPSERILRAAAELGLPVHLISATENDSTKSASPAFDRAQGLRKRTSNDEAYLTVSVS
jgi:transcriptional regulator with XRE-family HTH domain